jgi:hypothetical protein
MGRLVSFERSLTRSLLSTAILAVALTVGLGADAASAEEGKPSSSAVPPAANHDASAGAHPVTPDDLGTDEFVTLAGGSYFTSLDPDAAGKCLDVYDWGVGPWIQMWGCHGYANQDWGIDGTAPLFRTITISSHHSGRCIDAAWGRGVQVRQWTCDNSGTQEFYIHDFADGSQAFESAYLRGQCLDIRDWGQSNIVQLWDCHWGANQRWWFGYP